jgi:hypothetical protein
MKKIYEEIIDIQGKHALQSVCIFLNKNQICHIYEGQSCPLFKSQTLFNG